MQTITARVWIPRMRSSVNTIHRLRQLNTPLPNDENIRNEIFRQRCHQMRDLARMFAWDIAFLSPFGISHFRRVSLMFYCRIVKVMNCVTNLFELHNNCSFWWWMIIPNRNPMKCLSVNRSKIANTPAWPVLLIRRETQQSGSGRYSSISVVGRHIRTSLNLLINYYLQFASEPVSESFREYLLRWHK